MKKFFLLVLLVSIVCFFSVDAQVDTLWVKRFSGPTNSEDVAKIIKVDNYGFIYVGGVVSTVSGYKTYGVIKYTPEGDTLWVRYYNSPFSLGSELYDMAIDNNNNVIVTGSSDGTNYSDCATVKYDSAGNLLWAKRYDNGDIDQAFALAVDESGNICITGTSSKPYESDNYIIIKYNPNGDTLWTYTFAGNEGAMDIARAIAVDNSGSIIVSGTTDWYWGTIDFVTIKLNPSGDTVWTVQYDSPQNGYDYFSAMAVDNSNNIYVTGVIYPPNDIITIKYNPYGDTIWTKRYNGPANGDDNVYAIAVDALGNVYVAGKSYNTGTGFDYLTIKYNASGVQQWVSTYTGSGIYVDYAYSIALDDFGNVFVTGATESFNTNFDYATIKYDSDGNEKWVIKYNGPGNLYDYANSICLDNSGYVYVTGSSLGIGTGNDFVTIKYTQSPSDLKENPLNIPAEFKLFENYPNPFNPSTKISWQSPVGSWQTIKVYDVLGNEVTTLIDEYRTAGKYEVEFYPASSIKHPASGLYFYQLKAGEFIQTKKMVLIK